jgi:hypothetical protein
MESSVGRAYASKTQSSAAATNTTLGTSACTPATDGGASHPFRGASKQVRLAENSCALLAQGSFARAMGGGQSVLEPQRRARNEARPPLEFCASPARDAKRKSTAAPAPESRSRGLRAAAKTRAREGGRACHGTPSGRGRPAREAVGRRGDGEESTLPASASAVNARPASDDG